MGVRALQWGHLFLNSSVECPVAARMVTEQIDGAFLVSLEAGTNAGWYPRTDDAYIGRCEVGGPGIEGDGSASENGHYVLTAFNASSGHARDIRPGDA